METPKDRWSYSRCLERFYWLVLLLTTAIAVACIAVSVTVKDLPSLDDPTKGFESRGTDIKGRSVAVERLFESQTVSAVPSTAATRRRKRQDASCRYRNIQPYDVDDTVKLVFESVTGDTMWSLEAIQEMCAMDRNIVLTSKHAYNPECPSHSVGYYIGLLVNKTCEQLVEIDLQTAMQTLRTCAPAYYDAWDSNADFLDLAVPPCSGTAASVAYTILHYLTDADFLGRNSRTNEHLKYAAMFLDLQFESSRDFYLDEIHGKDLRGTYVSVAAVDVTDRFDIFTVFLFREMVYFIVAVVLIFLIVGLYLRSLLITLVTLLDIIFSFGIAYFLYIVVFNIPHMPFLGLLSILLLIAIGADDVFIFCDSFEQCKAAHPEAGVRVWISETLRHAAVSILVTSLTTGAALYANLVSNITDIKGFGIISGTAIVTNYLLIITWIPAAVIAIEKINNCCCSQITCCACFEKFTDFLKKISKVVFHDFLPVCVSKLWFFWLLVFLGLGIGGIVVTFVSPRLDLPSSQDFALFNRDHVIEVWFQDLKYKFRHFQKNNDERLGSGMYLIALWGVKGEDTGNHLDPDSVADLRFDSSFNLSTPEAQLWMQNFCHTLRQNASFVDQREIQERNCSMDIFYSYVTRNCSEIEAIFGSLFSDTECCGRNTTPLEPDLFSKCYYLFTDVLYRTNILGYGSTLGTAYYEAGTTTMKAYSFEFRSNQGWTGHFQTMETFYNGFQNWMNSRLKSAPPELEQGWMTSRFESFDLFDLQQSLASGTYSAIGVSMAAAFVVMLITSLNVIITCYAIFTIFMTISVCAGILVLLGWELNIVESVTLTMAVGLSIDFCIHYGMGYKLSKLKLRRDRVYESFKKVGPAVFMAALTTFIAGACVMPATVLFYVQLGTFLMLVMAFSWLFATFFFQSLCYVAGPNGNFCQIPTPFQICSSEKGSSLGSEAPMVNTVSSVSETVVFSGRDNQGFAPEQDLGFWSHQPTVISPDRFRGTHIKPRLTKDTFSSQGDKSHSLAKNVILT